MKSLLLIFNNLWRMGCVYCFASALVSTPVWGQSNNYQAGGAQLDISSSFSAQYNSNITTSTGGGPDWILTPGVNFALSCPLTQLNHFSLSLGIGYQYYLHNRQLSSGSNFFSIAPNSNIQAMLLFGNVTTVVYDSITYSTDDTDLVLPGGQVGVGNYGRFGNTVGANTTWDLNAVQLGLNLSRSDVYPYGKDSAAFEYTRSWTYTASPYVGVSLNPDLVMGVQQSTAWNFYKIGFDNNSISYSVGPFMNWALSPVWSINASTGYYWSTFSQSGSNGDNSQPNGLQWNISTMHIMNAKYQHRVFFNKSFEYGYINNATDIITLGYSFQWMAFVRTALNGAIVLDTGKDSGGPSAEDYKRYTVDGGCNFNLTPKMSISVNGQYCRKTSNLALASYTQFLVSLGANYAF